MRIEIINKVKNFLREYPDSSIKSIANSLDKNQSTIRDYIHYLMNSNEIVENRNSYPYTYSLKIEKTEETTYEELEIIMTRVIKQTLWEMPLEKRLIKSGVYYKGQLFYEEDVNEMMKKYPNILVFEFKTINQAFDKNLTNDESFISNIALKVGVPPDDSNFKKLLWRCFSKIKIAIPREKF